MVIGLDGYSSNRFLNLGWRNFLILMILFLAVLIWYSIAFGYSDCKDWECFNDNLEKCSRAKFVGGSDMIFDYTIIGISGEMCEVDVHLLRSNLNDVDSGKIDGQSMVCSLPKGVIVIPEGDIGNCHGLLKEGLQDLIIEKLHSYLVSNLGKINLDMLE